MKRMALDEFNSIFKKSLTRKSITKKIALSAIGKLIEDETVSLLGHEQPEWEPLSEATEEIKLKGGYALNAPLVREGELKYSISYDVSFGGDEVTVGTPLPEAVDQEFGTMFIPARPFLWLAFFKKEFLVDQIIFSMLCSYIDNSNIVEVEKMSKLGGFARK